MTRTLPHAIPTQTQDSLAQDNLPVSKYQAQLIHRNLEDEKFRKGSTMTYIVTVVYPTGTKFNMDYYLTKHMPLVQELWRPHGLKSWKVANYTNPDAPYSVQAWLEWESKEHSEKGIASQDGSTIFADVSKFSDQQPAVLSGELVGSVNL
ncbi:hypothetical protein HD806DRAFT_60964 [Xylariaceae sp. AK1471]|nr:hypothetical protein HD806DRAFT_60964 [Xylariaceae sp. AK1471]